MRTLGEGSVRMRPLGGAWLSSKPGKQARGPRGSPGAAQPRPCIYAALSCPPAKSGPSFLLFLSPWDVWGHRRTRLGAVGRQGGEVPFQKKGKP